MNKKRCSWVNPQNELYVKYHDKEWGRPQHNDQMLFELLILEGAQAGLSWETILKKRENYRRAFANFDAKKMARFNQTHVKKLMQNEGIVRNKLKIESTISNARAFLKTQKEFGTFDKYIWSFVGGKPIPRKPGKSFLTHSAESDALSKDLKKRGFRFVGTTIMYAFMQATGLVNDHAADCFRYGRK